jgi:hypothetical protein
MLQWGLAVYHQHVHVHHVCMYHLLPPFSQQHALSLCCSRGSSVITLVREPWMVPHPFAAGEFTARDVSASIGRKG